MLCVYYYVAMLVNIMMIMITQVCFYGCLPGCIIKQVVNVAQLCSAADVLAARDAETAKKVK
jgi:hypothetical protein